MKKWKCLLPVLFYFCLVSCTPLVFFGAGTLAGVGGYKFYKGGLTVIYQAPYMKTWDATLKAFENMNFEIQSKKHDRTAGKIKAQRADKKPVNVAMEYKSAQETEVQIRVGIFGNEAASIAIKEEIKKTLFNE